MERREFVSSLGFMLISRERRMRESSALVADAREDADALFDEEEEGVDEDDADAPEEPADDDADAAPVRVSMIE